MDIISTICAIIVGVAMFVTPVLLLIFLIRWAMKKAKKKLGIATLICAGCFILFTIIGTATAPSTYCNHEYQLVSSESPTCEKKGFEMYHCNLCDTDRKNKLNKLGHDMKEVSHKEPTYDVGGEIVYQCTRCEERDITVIKKLKKPKETNPSAETIETVVTAFSSTIRETLDTEPEPTSYLVTEPSPANPPITSTIDVNRDVSFAEIYKSFEMNSINAEDVYNDKYFVITAKINGMKTGGFLGLEKNVTTLTMEIQVENTIVFFLAKFDAKQREALKSVAVGDEISFIGKCDNGNFYDCILE